jgi:antitoxin HicB
MTMVGGLLPGRCNVDGVEYSEPEPKVELAGPEYYFEMQTLNYRIRLMSEEEGGYTVIVPALPGCVTFGETIDEAIAMAKEAIEGYIETLNELGKKVPKDNDCMPSCEMPTLALKSWQNCCGPEKWDIFLPQP